MKLKLKTLKGTETAFDVDDEATTLELKQKMAEQFSVSVDSLHVVYNGAQLKDDLKLKDQGVTDGKPLFYFSKISRKPPVQQPSSSPQQPPSTTTSHQPTPTPAPVSSWGSQSTHPTSSPSSSTASTPASTGGVSEAALHELVAMGYDRTQSEAALKAAFGDVNVAVEYLMNGIPQDLASFAQASPADSAVPASAQNATTEEIDPAVFDEMTPEQLRAMAHRQDPIPVPGMPTPPSAPASDTSALQDAPQQLIALMNILRQNPQYPMFYQLSQTSPANCARLARELIAQHMPQVAGTIDVDRLVQVIRASPPLQRTPSSTRLPADLFNGRLPEIAQRLGVTLPPAGTPDVAPGQTFTVFGDSGIRARSTGQGIEVAISAQDNAQVEHIKAVTGCSAQAALEAYLVCGKDVDAAINFIMDNK